MQGWKRMISTEEKVAYLNCLMDVGFDTLDCGSFVSPKAVPQMADTSLVLQKIKAPESATKLLVIVANMRGANEAVAFENISYLGYPFSISPTFQLKNTGSNMGDSERLVEELQDLCIRKRKQLVVYLSMGFGNPYGDKYDDEVLLHWAKRFAEKGIKKIMLSDTVGLATPNQIANALSVLIPEFAEVEFGVHLHSDAKSWEGKLLAAMESGCRRFDGAINGIGGCPMSGTALVGNLDTVKMIAFFKRRVTLNINETALQQCITLANKIFIEN